MKIPPVSHDPKERDPWYDGIYYEKPEMSKRFAILYTIGILLYVALLVTAITMAVLLVI